MKRYYKKVIGILAYETEMFYLGVFGTIATLLLVYISLVFVSKTVFAEDIENHPRNLYKLETIVSK